MSCCPGPLDGVILTERDLYNLTCTLRAAAPQWRVIGGTLGILDSDLTIIQHTPVLVQEGPPACFREMLTQWLKWAPPNHPIPTVETLALALQKNGHEALAANLRSLFLQKKGKRVMHIFSSESTRYRYIVYHNCRLNHKDVNFEILNVHCLVNQETD